MAQVFKRKVDGPATHAFVLGIGDYPHAKPGKGSSADLRAVPNVSCAPDSAKLMCDWLIANKDNLAAPLASIEALIGETEHAPGVTPYPWKKPLKKPSQPPTKENVQKAGEAWIARLKERPGDTAFFYACGHGARLGNEPVVFLQDLNADNIDPWGSYLNVGETANAFKQFDEIKTAFFFLDACQEFSTKFEFARTMGGARFIAPHNPFKPGKEKVFLLSATAAGMKTYDGPWAEDETVRLGRFTQTLCMALNGASVRFKSGRWTVYPGCLWEDIKLLYGLRPDWREDDLPFEPTQFTSPNELTPILTAASPRVPIVVFTEPPAAIGDYFLSIFPNPDRTGQAITRREVREATEWLAWTPASKAPHFAVADDGNGVFHQEVFNPDTPIFDQRIAIA